MSCWIKPTDRPSGAPGPSTGIATREVVVNGHHMNPAPVRARVVGQGGHKSLALTSFHFSYLSFMKDHAPNQLNVEMTHTENPLTRFTYHRKGFGQNLVQNRALVYKASCGSKPLPERCCFITQFIVRKGRDLLFQQIDV